MAEYQADSLSEDERKTPLSTFPSSKNSHGTQGTLHGSYESLKASVNVGCDICGKVWERLHERMECDWFTNAEVCHRRWSSCSWEVSETPKRLPSVSLKVYFVPSERRYRWEGDSPCAAVNVQFGDADAETGIVIGIVDCSEGR